MANSASAARIGVDLVRVGPIQTNCYLLDAGQGIVVVDPGADADAILARVGEKPIEAVLVTHAHFDHVGAVDAVAARSRSGWYLGEGDAPLLGEPLVRAAAMFGCDVEVASAPARLVADGDRLTLAGIDLAVVTCPGHTPGGVTYLVEDARLAFTGDTLFAGSAGRCDLYGGDERALMRSLSRLATLDPAFEVFPGHGPGTSIARELAGNPWLAQAARG